MGLRKKKSLIDQASDYVETVRPQVEAAVGTAVLAAMDAAKEAKDRAIPLLADARDKAGPALADPDRAIRLVSGSALVAAVVVGVTGTASGWLLLGSLDGFPRKSSTSASA